MVICTTLQPEHWTTNHQTQESNNSKRQSIVSLPTYVHPVSQSVSQSGIWTGLDSVRRWREGEGDAQLRNEIFLYHPTIVQKVFKFLSHQQNVFVGHSESAPREYSLLTVPDRTGPPCESYPEGKARRASRSVANRNYVICGLIIMRRSRAEQTTRLHNIRTRAIILDSICHRT